MQDNGARKEIKRLAGEVEALTQRVNQLEQKPAPAKAEAPAPAKKTEKKTEKKT